MNQLTKEMILATSPKLEKIKVPEWGGSVFIRPVTLAEQAKLADLGTKFEKTAVVDRMKNITLRLVQWAVSDSDGQPLFDQKDLEALMTKSAISFLRLQDAILRLSGLTEAPRKELEKNLQSAPNGGPDSD